MTEHTTLNEQKFGLLPRFKHWVIGRRDPVQRAQREMEHRGRVLTAVMHFASYVMLVLFSLGSAVGITGDLVRHVLAVGPLSWAALTSNIVILVSLALVLCMDLGDIYAAFNLRDRARRQEPFNLGYVWDIAAIVVATGLEGGTFIYMSFHYDSVVGTGLAILVIGRGIFAPLYAIYLNMARPTPPGVADVSYRMFMGSAAGVERKIVAIANDPDATLVDGVAMMRASARINKQDNSTLDAMMAAAEGYEQRKLLRPASPVISHRLPSRAGAVESAAYTAPEPSATMHNNMRHDGWYNDDVPTEYDGPDSGGDLFATRNMAAVTLGDLAGQNYAPRDPWESNPSDSQPGADYQYRDWEDVKGATATKARQMTATSVQTRRQNGDVANKALMGMYVRDILNKAHAAGEIDTNFHTIEPSNMGLRETARRVKRAFDDDGIGYNNVTHTQVKPHVRDWVKEQHDKSRLLADSAKITWDTEFAPPSEEEE